MSEFGSLNLEEMQGEDNRLNEPTGSGGAFLDQFVPMPNVKPGQTGTVAVRILPPMKGGKLFQFNRTHTVNGRKIHCPRPLVNGKFDRNTPCPICDYYSGLWQKADKLEKMGQVAEANELKAEARAIKPVERYYYSAIVRSMIDKDGKTLTNEGPRILSVGVKLHKMIIRAIVGVEGDPDSKLGNITDIKTGYDFVIRKEVTPGEDNYPNYDRSSFARQPSPLGEPDEIQKWQENIIDLSKLRNPKTVDLLEKELAIHRGLIPDDGESFDMDAFDSKWGAPASQSSSVSVTVPEGAPSKATSESVLVSDDQPSSVESIEEDLPIEDDDFLNELKSM